MNLKIDTKEKFHVITFSDSTISATMAEDFEKELATYLQNDVKNVIIKLSEVVAIDLKAAEKLAQIQQNFYENGASFVLCDLQEAVESFLEENELLEIMNVTPTESEAWDIVQMEEIERELGF